VLTETDKDFAYRTYVLGSITNPKTGRVYTEAEAHEKYRKALEKRRI